MNKKKKIWGVIAVILVVILIAFGVSLYNDFKQEDILMEEIQHVLDEDLLKTTIDMEIKTKGEYAIVEKTIKEFAKEYSDLGKEIMEIIDDEKLTTLLTIKNYQQDGPNFVSSLRYIDNTRRTFNENFERLVELTNKEYVENLINDKNVTSYYKDLYLEIMLKNTEIEDLEDVVKDLENSKKELDKILDISENTLEFLSKYQAYWDLDNQYIYFDNDVLLNQYNTYINGLTVETH